MVDEVGRHRHDHALAAVRRVPRRVVEQRLVEQHAELPAKRDGAGRPRDAEIRAAEERVAGRGRGAVVQVEALFELEQRMPAAAEILAAFHPDLRRQNAVVLQAPRGATAVGVGQVLYAGVERAVQHEGRLRACASAGGGECCSGRDRADEARVHDVEFSIPVLRVVVVCGCRVCCREAVSVAGRPRGSRSDERCGKPAPPAAAHRGGEKRA